MRYEVYFNQTKNGDLYIKSIIVDADSKDEAMDKCEEHIANNENQDFDYEIHHAILFLDSIPKRRIAICEHFEEKTDLECPQCLAYPNCPAKGNNNVSK